MKSPRISSFTLIVAFLCVALAGLAFLPLLPVKLSPSRTLPKLTIRYNMPGNSARVVEMEATSRLEAMLARIKGIKEITSTSGNGWGMITLALDKHTDPDVARFEASTIIRQTWPLLPDELDYPVLEMSRPDDKEARPFMTYTLNASASPIFIQRFAEEQIKPRLSNLQGIYRIDISGATPMEWQLEYDSRQLSLLGITVDDLQAALLQYQQKEFLGLANLTSSARQAERKNNLRRINAPVKTGDPNRREQLRPRPDEEIHGPAGYADQPAETAGRTLDEPTDTYTGKSTEKITGKTIGKFTASPTEKLSESPTEKLTESPTEKLLEGPTARPSEKTTGKLSENSIGKLTESPTEKFVRKPSAKLSGEQTEKSSEKLSEKPSQKTTGQLSAKSGEWVRLALVPEAGPDGLDVSRITVKNKAGKLIRLDQLLRVVREEEEPQSYYRINGLNSIYLSIRADESANQLQLAHKVKKEMEHIHTLLPPGYEIHTSYDATEFIREELNKIYIRTGLTVLILLFFVLLITRNVRYLFLIVVSLCINLCIAVIFFYLLGLEMQLYSLAGITISLSLVIDNTIVMTDHIRNRHDKKAFLAILTATLTTIGALAIIFFLDEKIRLNLQDFAAVVIVNLAVSLAVALWLVPALIEKMGLENKQGAAFARFAVRSASPSGSQSNTPSGSPAESEAGSQVAPPSTSQIGSPPKSQPIPPTAAEAQPQLIPQIAAEAQPQLIPQIAAEVQPQPIPPTAAEAKSPSASSPAPQSSVRTLYRAVRHGIRRFPVYFTRYYDAQIRFLCRWKKTACLLLVLAFGLPVFLLPEKIEPSDKNKKKTVTSTFRLQDNRRAARRESKFRKEREKMDSLFIAAYNRFVANDTYKETVKPFLDKALGGTLRLFVEKVYQGSYFTRNDETVLSVGATLPNGSTLPQMNHLVGRMETFLSTCPGIRQFQTHIYNARQAGIYIYFTRESERSGYPYQLKSQIVSKALELGGGSWNVWGLQDQGFSNDVRENAGTYHIEMYGYNYDELYEWAEKLKEELLTYRRIKEVLINSEFSWWKEDYQEFYFRLDKARMAGDGLRPDDLFASLRPAFTHNLYSGHIVAEGETEKLKLTARQAREYDIWSMQYLPWQTAEGKTYKLADIADVAKDQAPQQVAKINQQYRLCLQYEYIGARSQGTKIQEKALKAFNRTLPMGYVAKADSTLWTWEEQDTGQYALLLLIIVIIFFTTSILFNSLRQPLAVIFVIPISYIGVFLTFYGFKLNFDQGGFASFVLLCGITVNASIYILNEYNRLRDRSPLLPPRRAYLKAWNAKITPIFLTVISTILGFIPFMLGPDKEAFWFPLAAGTIGGLILSIAGIFFYLPIFTVKKDTC